MRLLGLLVLVAAVFLILRMAKGIGGAAGSRRCGHCGQQIPAIGAFCPICGQRTV